jgi:hypothetical protein
MGGGVGGDLRDSGCSRWEGGGVRMREGKDLWEIGGQGGGGG